MGEVIQIGEHSFTLPNVPKKAVSFTGAFGDNITIPLDQLILNKKAKKDDAYWKRCELPKYFYDYQPDVTELDADQTVYQGSQLISLNKSDTSNLSYIFEREMYRREHGVWMKNEDELVWLTGNHYFFLQWMKMFGLSEKMVPKWRPKGYEYAEYREFQRDIFYLIEKVNGDSNILGMYVAKSKKTGVTQLFAGYKLNKATMSRMKMMGVMSKSDDAIKVNMRLFLFGFDGLPMIFQPTIKNRGDEEGNIIFGEPPVRNTRTVKGQQRRIQIQNSKPLDTRVWAAKTKAAGFDSPTMSDIFFDELPKYDTENKQQPKVVFMRNRDTVKLQSFYNGRIWIFSYPPEMDTPGFFQARDIYFGSKLSTIGNNPLGRTETGLIVYYVSALNSFMECFDKYGRCDSKKAHQLNQIERKSTKDKKQQQALKRLYSETERECWSSSGAGSTFDNIRIGELEFDLKEQLTMGNRFYTEGRLDWDNTMWEAGSKSKRPLKEFCNIKYVKLSDAEINDGKEGRLRFYCPLEMLREDICASLRRPRDEEGNLMPPLNIKNYGAMDPTELAEGQEVNTGSKNANYTMNLANPALDVRMGKVMSNTILSEYFFRPDNPEEYYQDVVKEIIFLDKYVIVEANKKWVATRLIQDGLGRFMLIKNKETGVIEPWTPKHKRMNNYTLISTNKEDIGTIIRSISKFLVPPGLGEIDHARSIKSERLFPQLMDFDPTDTTKYDLVMAFGWALICGEVLQAIPMNFQDPIYSSHNVQAVWGAFEKAS